MQSIYQSCVCGSGITFNFCCKKKSPEDLLQQSAQFPIYQCLISEEQWKNSGLAIVLVSRTVSDGRFNYGMYMVDTYCLGLKDTFAQGFVGWEEYVLLRGKLNYKFELESIDYENARSLILGAIDYARGLGFEPHSDFEQSRDVIEADREYKSIYQFGKDGKPHYVQGPKDNTEKIRGTLDASQREYDFSVPTSIMEIKEYGTPHLRLVRS